LILLVTSTSFSFNHNKDIFNRNLGEENQKGTSGKVKNLSKTATITFFLNTS